MATVLVLIVVGGALILWPVRRDASAMLRGEIENSRRATTAVALLHRLPDGSIPILLALVMALASWPLVALTFGAVDTSGGSSYNPQLANPATALGQWSAAASAVFVAAGVASAVGGPVVRRRPVAGGLLTFVVALVVAIAALPLLPAVMGQNVGVGCESITFNGPCTNFVVNSSNPISGLQADLLVVFAPIIEPWPVVVLAVGVGLWTAIVSQLHKDSR